MDGFDYINPDYGSVFEARLKRLKWLREKPEERFGDLLLYYKTHIPDMINDWGMTTDPRLVRKKLPASIPFVIFPRQRDWVDWFVERWLAGEPGITEKSRDMGLSWLMVSACCCLAITYRGFSAGFGSRKEIYVDAVGQPKALFWKAREFLIKLPREMRGGWSRKGDAHMRIGFPGTGSIITGESGDNIGRGDRTSVYLVDESAYLVHPDTVDAALSQTTDCRIDVSSVNGMGNSFAQKRHSGTIKTFTFHWRSDPRKNDAWYEKQKEDIANPTIVAQEIDIDYGASSEGVLIPSKYVQAAVDAHTRLGITVTGDRSASLDVSDGGGDFNAFGSRRGVLVDRVEQWSGRQVEDTGETTEMVFGFCDELGLREFTYDAVGIGSGVKASARLLNRTRVANPIAALPYVGSEGVLNPQGQMILGRDNEDMFVNRKAQDWWGLRLLFMRTYRAVIEGREYDPSDIISISSRIKYLDRLVMELAQPQYKKRDGDGKLLVDKAPEGTKSPNLGDMIMMLYARKTGAVRVGRGALDRSRSAGQRGLIRATPTAAQELELVGAGAPAPRRFSGALAAMQRLNRR